MNNSMAFYARALILTAISVVVLMVNIDYTAVNLALVPIARQLHVNLQTVQWVLGSYVLTWAAFCIPAGSLADIYGRRRAFLFGVTIFTAASIVAGVAPNISVLIISRALQGLGGALFIAPAYNIIFAIFPQRHHGLAIGIIGAAVGLGLAIGPSVGGIILHWLLWRWLFYINVPLGIAVIVTVLWLIPREAWRISQQRFPVVNAVLWIVLIYAVMLLINDIAIQQHSFLKIAVLMAITALTSLFFAWRHYHIKRPLIKFSLLMNQPFVGCLIAYFMLSICFSSLLIIMALFIQNVLHYSNYQTGLIFMGMTIVWGVISPFGGRLIDVFGVKLPVIFAGLTLALAFLGLASLGVQASLITLLGCLFLAGIGLAVLFTALNTHVMAVVPAENLSMGSSMFVTSGLIGNPVGLIMSSFLYSQLTLRYVVTHAQTHMQLSTHQVVNLFAVISRAHFNVDGLVSFSQQSKLLLTNLIIHGYRHSMGVIMIVAAILALSVVIDGLITIRRK